jgi:hypothetical protein
MCAIGARQELRPIPRTILRLSLTERQRLGAWLVVTDESALFHAPLLIAYAAFLCLPVYLFVIFY